MLRLGLVSAGSYGPIYSNPDAPRIPGSYHGTAFACTFNGFDAAKAAQLYQAHNYSFAAATKRIPDCKIVKVWDPLPEAAKMLAETCFIPEIAETPEACCDDVDAVIIVDDGTGTQYQYAFYPLEKGTPVFCDKPLAMTTKEALKIQQAVERTGTKFMSASSLRFVPDIVHTREEVATGKYGDVWMAVACCGNHLVYYGIHALSMAYGVFGRGAVSVINVGQEKRNIVRVRFANGRDVVLIVGEQPYVSAGWQFNLYGQKGWKAITPDLTDLYTYLLQAFVDNVIHNKQTVSVEEEVEVIAALEAGLISLRERREVYVAELLKG